MWVVDWPLLWTQLEVSKMQDPVSPPMSLTGYNQMVCLSDLRWLGYIVQESK